jgi:outer membrane lipoprotein LolB
MSLVMEREDATESATQSFSGAFELRGNAQKGELDLLSPLGQTVMQLRWSPGQAELIQGQDRLRFPSAQALLSQATGASLTPDALFAWLQGTSAARPSSAAGSWQVDLSERDRGRITARRDPPAKAVLRIILDQP